VFDFLSYLELEQHSENIEQVQQQLQEYILKEGLANYGKIKDPQFSEFAKALTERRTFMELCKKAYQPKSIERQPDPNSSFFNYC
jgi:hypothetical protein